MTNKNKKINKILSNIMTLAMVFMMSLNTYVFALEDGDVKNILIEVTQVLLTIAGLVCVGKLIQIGIMYMMSSAVDKSNAKSAVLPWLVGTIVCFGAAWIGGTLITIFDTGKENVLSY